MFKRHQLLCFVIILIWK